MLRFSSEVMCICCNAHASSSSAAVFCLMDGRILSLPMDLILNDLSRFDCVLVLIISAPNFIDT